MVHPLLRGGKWVRALSKAAHNTLSPGATSSYMFFSSVQIRRRGAAAARADGRVPDIRSIGGARGRGLPRARTAARRRTRRLLQIHAPLQGTGRQGAHKK